MSLQSELAAQRQDLGFAKEKSFQKKVKVEKQAYLAKMTSAVQTKEERLENEQRLAEHKLTCRLSALEKKDAVKKSMMKSQRKLDSYRMQRIQAVICCLLISVTLLFWSITLSASPEQQPEALTLRELCPPCAVLLSDLRFHDFWHALHVQHTV